MNNKKKLLLANLFALFALATMIAGIKLLGLDFGLSPGAVVTNGILIFVPQMAFIYLYWMSCKTESRKAIS
jgi:hypothetical protein